MRRYLKIILAKEATKLGGSDWSRRDLSKEHLAYMSDDVRHLPALWDVLKAELERAGLSRAFAMRMEFFPHLNQIKMTGNPIDAALRDNDRSEVLQQKDGIREELRKLFSDYRHPIPPSRKKTIKIQADDGKFKRVPGPVDEEFSPSNRNHVLGALSQHGIPVEDIREATLHKIDSPETRLLGKYAKAKKRLEAIEGIVRATFSDSRVEPPAGTSSPPEPVASSPPNPTSNRYHGNGANRSGWNRRSFGSRPTWAKSRSSSWRSSPEIRT